MTEIITEALRPCQLPLTALLAVVVGYWLLAAVGAVGHDMLDGHFGFHQHAHSHLHSGGHSHGSPAHDAHSHGHSDAPDHGALESQSLALSVVGNVNPGELPITAFISLVVLVLWGLGMIANHHWNPSGNGWWAMGLGALDTVLAILLVSLATRPLRPLMRAMSDTPAAVSLMGQTAHVRSQVLTHEQGQVELRGATGAPLILHARLVSAEDPPLSVGAEVLILSHDPARQHVSVAPCPRSLSA
jgi:hypothetical protein